MKKRFAVMLLCVAVHAKEPENKLADQADQLKVIIVNHNDHVINAGNDCAGYKNIEQLREQLVVLPKPAFIGMLKKLAPRTRAAYLNSLGVVGKEKLLKELDDKDRAELKSALKENEEDWVAKVQQEIAHHKEQAKRDEKWTIRGVIVGVIGFICFV